MKKCFKIIEKIFEWFLWKSRFIVLVAVITSIASAIVLTVFGTLDIYYALKDVMDVFQSKDAFYQIYTKLLGSVVSAMDLYLIATVLLIFGIGLYELFISRIDQVEDDSKSSGILKIHSLDELKEKLLKVIHVVLVVYFFKYAIKLEYKTITDLALLAGSILVIAASMFLTKKK
ncbi:MAG: YqhA family protein [Spirochaetota bacterium]|nr:YqhA family protein [Spirochaetota bacterium]